jgi:hypothetical protein
LLEKFYGEWRDICQTVINAVGQENLVLAKVNLYLGDSVKSAFLNSPTELPPGIDMNATDMPFFDSYEYASNPWMKGVLTKIGSNIYVNPNYWKESYSVNPNLRFSALGDHGQVLTRKKSVLVTPYVWQNASRDIRKLQGEGYKIAVLPLVDPKKQKFPFVKEHIDGHSALIEEHDGDLVLPVLSSYFYQDQNGGKRIKQAAKSVGAEVDVIEDKQLPPLSLNLWQFQDGRIAMVNTGGGQVLEKKLEAYVGRSGLFVTERPVRELVKGKGSLGCMVNYFPRILLFSA